MKLCFYACKVSQIYSFELTTLFFQLLHLNNTLLPMAFQDCLIFHDKITCLFSQYGKQRTLLQDSYHSVTVMLSLPHFGSSHWYTHIIKTRHTRWTNKQCLAHASISFQNLATINLPKSPTFLGNFSNGVEIYHFSSEIILGQLLQTFGDFFLVTLNPTYIFHFIKSKVTSANVVSDGGL